MPKTTERGSAAGASTTGLLREVDYLGPMRPPMRWQTVPKMMSDPVISAGLSAIKEPILGLNWWVEPPTEDPEDVLIADFLTADLFDMPATDWPDYMTQVLRYLELGVMLFERVFQKRDDGLVHLEDLAPREPGSIVYWRVDPQTGRPTGVTQLVSGGVMVDYALDDLLVFTYKPTGGIMTGTSLLRSAYKPWFVWDQLERGEAVATTLRGAGVTTAKLKDEQVRDDAEEALMTVRVGEKNFLLETEGMTDFRIAGIEGAVLDFDVPIKRHQLNFLRAIGAEFIAMGGDAAGSRAMHTDKTNTFLLRLNGTADAIGSVHTRKLFPPLIAANFGPQAQGKAWRLKHSKIDTRDLSGLSEALAKLAERGFMSVQPGDEDWLRSAFDMPERDKTAQPSPTGEASGMVDGVPIEADAYAGMGGA